MPTRYKNVQLTVVSGECNCKSREVIHSPDGYRSIIIDLTKDKPVVATEEGKDLLWITNHHSASTMLIALYNKSSDD